MADQPKTDALREQGTLNPRPDRVTDARFHEGDFFDPRDLVQVKYEMIRRVRIDQVSVTQAVAEFGFSRPTFYATLASFDAAGLGGLVPKKRGPRGPHKLRGEVEAFVKESIHPGQPLRARELARRIRGTFGIKVHPRTIERAVGPRKKTSR